jgi:xanthine/uracil/vitamin C permease (AzgA family)
VVAAITMPLTYSIATGIGLGFITYALAKLIAGRFAECQTGGAGGGARFRRQICDRLADGTVNPPALS